MCGGSSEASVGVSGVEELTVLSMIEAGRRRVNRQEGELVDPGDSLVCPGWKGIKSGK